ncbi:hypothetical protein MRX96_014639 [Rhipicephalus microplus]
MLARPGSRVKVGRQRAGREAAQEGNKMKLLPRPAAKRSRGQKRRQPREAATANLIRRPRAAALGQTRRAPAELQKSAATV